MRLNYITELTGQGERSGHAEVSAVLVEPQILAVRGATFRAAQRVGEVDGSHRRRGAKRAIVGGDIAAPKGVHFGSGLIGAA